MDFVFADGVRVELRPGCADDRALVLATWMRSYAGRHKDVRPDIYHRDHPALIKALLDSGRLDIACSPGSQNTIHGWCASPAILSPIPAIHYVYVPHYMRGLGLARALISRALGSYPKTIETSHRWPHASMRFVFSPYHARITA